MSILQTLVSFVMLPAIAALTAMFTATPAAPTSVAQQDTIPRPRPGVFVPDSTGTMTPLRIRSLHVDVEVKGAMARTTFDVTVMNPHDRVLEGEFSFPLSDGQTVARFALDINGRLREGVVVSKTKGRETFESVIRQQVDPALLEWTRDNAFRARIYPIPPNGTRRIVIAYEQSLSSTVDGFTYHLPFTYDQHIDTFRLRVEVAGFGLQPSLAGDGGDTVAFTPRGRDFTAELAETNITLNGSFTLSVPVLSGRHYASVSTLDNEQYAGLFMSIPASSAKRVLPSRISLVVDASLSGARRDHAAEQAYLQSLFAQVPDVTVDVVTFAHRPLTTRTMKVIGGDWTSVRMMMDEVDHDGATQLGAVRFDEMRSDMIILLSDGLSTFGRHRPITGTVPVMCVVSGPQADHDVLRGIAAASGGRFIDLTKRDVDDAVRSTLEIRRSITNVTAIDGQIVDVLPGLPLEITGMTSLACKLRSYAATIVVTSSIGGRAIQTDTVSVDGRSLGQGSVSMARLWAQLELQRLSMDRTSNASAIEALGKRYTLVTPGTSLLVLDRVEDYVLHDIRPPASEPDLVAAFEAARQTIRRDSTGRYQEHLETVIRLFNERNEWYAKTFSAQRTPKIGETTIDANRQPAAAPGTQELADPMTPGRARRGNATVRGSRSTDISTQRVVVDGLSVSDQVAGGFGDAASSVAAAMPSPFAADDTQSIQHTPKGVIALTAPKDRAAYVDELSSLSSSATYARYLELRREHGTSTAFFIDVADMLREKGDTATALRVLSNLAELRGEDAPTLRILGYRLRQLGYHDLAVMVFEDVLRVREEEPQSYRDLGLALADAGRLQDACDRLYQLVLRPWDTRFPEVELIALHELNRIAATGTGKVSTHAYDARLVKDMPMGMRVVLSWDADNCDMDLWVTDPTGEKCFYSNRDTEIGGRLSRDLTGGYGPEEFVLKAPLKGTYTVQVHYYGDRQQRIAGPTTIHVDLGLNEGKRNASHKAITTRVDGVQKVVDIATFTID